MPRGGAESGCAHWSVYVLVSRRVARTYVGITTDPKRRLAQHNGRVPGGARSTRAARPWRIARLLGPYTSRSDAQKAEAELKRLRGRARLRAEVE
jgi:predicted GIY-YIG superfamily endonuclease